MIFNYFSRKRQEREAREERSYHLAADIIETLVRLEKAKASSRRLIAYSDGVGRQSRALIQEAESMHSRVA